MGSCWARFSGQEVVHQRAAALGVDGLVLVHERAVHRVAVARERALGLARDRRDLLQRDARREQHGVAEHRLDVLVAADDPVAEARRVEHRLALARPPQGVGRIDLVGRLEGVEGGGALGNGAAVRRGPVGDALGGGPLRAGAAVQRRAPGSSSLGDGAASSRRGLARHPHAPPFARRPLAQGSLVRRPLARRPLRPLRIANRLAPLSSVGSRSGPVNAGLGRRMGTRLQTLDRGIRALTLVAGHPSGLSVAEIAASLGVHRAIAYRLVATLEAHALVHRLPDGRIVPGGGTLALAAQSDGQLRAPRPALGRAARARGRRDGLPVSGARRGLRGDPDGRGRARLPARRLPPRQPPPADPRRRRPGDPGRARPPRGRARGGETGARRRVQRHARRASARRGGRGRGRARARRPASRGSNARSA